MVTTGAAGGGPRDGPQGPVQPIDEVTLLGAFLHLELESVLGANLFGRGVVDRLIDVGENALLHEVGDQLERLDVQLVRKVANDDRGLDGDALCIVRKLDAIGRTRRLRSGPPLRRLPVATTRAARRKSASVPGALLLASRVIASRDDRRGLVFFRAAPLVARLTARLEATQFNEADLLAQRGTTLVFRVDLLRTLVLGGFVDGFDRLRSIRVGIRFQGLRGRLRSGLRGRHRFGEFVLLGFAFGRGFFRQYRGVGFHGLCLRGLFRWRG
jgi:hypothetical protein